MSYISTIRLVFCENFISPAFPEQLLDRYDTQFFAFIVTDEQTTLYIVSSTNSVAEADSGVDGGHSETIYIFHGITAVTTTDSTESIIEDNESVRHLRNNYVFISIITLAMVYEEQFRHDVEDTANIRTVFTEEEVVSHPEFMSVLTDIELESNVNISREVDRLQAARSH